MKVKHYYELWICYGRNKWYDLKRTADTLDRIKHIASEIAKEHTKTTKIGIVKVELKKDTLEAQWGTNTVLRPRQMKKCHQCGKRRKNKNINPKSGVCISCELRESVNKNQTAFNELMTYENI
jgi:hypothetical protein